MRVGRCGLEGSRGGKWGERWMKVRRGGLDGGGGGRAVRWWIKAVEVRGCARLGAILNWS